MEVPSIYINLNTKSWFDFFLTVGFKTAAAQNENILHIASLLVRKALWQAR